MLKLNFDVCVYLTDIYFSGWYWFPVHHFSAYLLYHSQWSSLVKKIVRWSQFKKK